MFGRMSLRLIPAALILAAASCSSGETHYSVEGKLLYNGQPAVGAMVIFHREGDSSLNSPKPSGQVGEDGTFKLETADRKGAPAGTYVVVVYWEKKPEAGKAKLGMAGGERERESGTDRMKGTPYASAETTPLKATIKGNTVLEPFRID